MIVSSGQEGNFTVTHFPRAPGRSDQFLGSHLWDRRVVQHALLLYLGYLDINTIS